jgi:hypothetical protein
MKDLNCHGRYLMNRLLFFALAAALAAPLLGEEADIYDGNICGIFQRGASASRGVVRLSRKGADS